MKRECNNSISERPKSIERKPFIENNRWERIKT